MVVFEKSQGRSENLTKFEKRQIFLVKIYKTIYFPKPSNGKKNN